MKAKSWGYSDVQLAAVLNMNPGELRGVRKVLGVRPVYKLVDTCAAEFEAFTPYYYSTYEAPYTINGEPVFEDEIRLTDRQKVVIVGGGPNRIGQGIEFDYCCVQAAFAMKELGYESVMVNSNPETVSTDYDTSDLLFFEPLTLEDIVNIYERLNTSRTNSLEILDESARLTREEFEGVRREAEVRSFGPSVIAFVTRGQKAPEAAGIVVLSRLKGPFIFIVRPDGSILEVFEDPDSIKGRIRSDPAFEEKLNGWINRPGLVKGVIVQFGGQTPLNLARGLKEAGVPILGTTVESLDAAGDREQFRQLLQKLGLKQPANGIARNPAEAREIARQIGYPVLVRPSFVLGGRAMEIVYDEPQLNYYMTHAVEASTITDAPILVDKFLDAATEVDVDCISDFDTDEKIGTGAILAPIAHDETGKTGGEKTAPVPILAPGQAIVIGVMEHIEEAGIHSGDSACALPPYSPPPEIVSKLKDQTKALAQALRVRGLMNVQYAIKDGEIYVIEVNPRASRTVPFVSKATGIPWAKIAAKVMAGKSLAELGAREQPDPPHTSVKESVFPFAKFPGVDVILGPEMRSTGEVMGIDHNFPLAFAKSQIAAGGSLPTKGTVFISVRNADKSSIIPAARLLADCGFEIIASEGTFNVLKDNGVPATRIAKLSEGRPNISDYIKNKKVQLLINTPTKKGPQTDEGKIRAMAVLNKVPIVTTITGANAAARAIQAMQQEQWDVRPLQDYFAGGR
ncbi:MAG TPA: hypothetical protein VN541_14145 [Tepidisphaeraceae bacterium]|nr:hypothetical protein [Tepidisphaeraceae bacterium]